MPDIWFFVGLALGTIVTGFCAVGAFDRGSASVRCRSWSREHDARNRALVAPRAAVRAVARPTADGALSKAS